MLEILQFYVSGFWVWVGLTTGLSIVGGLAVQLIVGVVAALRSKNVTIN